MALAAEWAAIFTWSVDKSQQVRSEEEEGGGWVKKMRLKFGWL
jgi:hypothetical protein